MNAQPASPAVEIQDLTKTFGAVRAVDGLSLTVRRGEVVAFLGPNGAGKSTTLDTVLGFTRPTSGTVRVLGEAPAEAVAASRVSAVLQDGGLLPGYTVGETLNVVASLQAVEPDVDDVVERTRLRPLLRRRVSRLSGGERQRLRLALALLPDPELLVLDEPLAGIDRASREALASILTGLRAQGLTLLTVLHEMGELADVVERAVVLDEGRVVSDGPVTDVAPDNHDHSRHDSLGHDHLDDCEHEHPHGDTGPAVHHAPVLSTSLPDQDGRPQGGTR